MIKKHTDGLILTDLGKTWLREHLEVGLLSPDLTPEGEEAYKKMLEELYNA